MLRPEIRLKANKKCFETIIVYFLLEKNLEVQSRPTSQRSSQCKWKMGINK